jgi:mannose-6-phosphate isomerase-like protein (cupin superfamily)
VLAAFIEEVYRLLGPAAEQASALRSGLADLAASAPNPSPAPPCLLPVCRCWEPCLETMHAGPLERLAVVLRESGPRLAWRQNPGYRAALVGPQFLENYGYAEIIGRGGLAVSDRVAAGLLLLGPETAYPPHAHPAAEHYYVLSGTARWGLGGSSPTVRPPGSLICHPPDVPHEMRTENDPLLALYLWQGDLLTGARLV